MVKAIYLIKRKSGADLEAFRRYWLTTHAELVFKVPGIRKYVQSHTLLSGYQKGEPIFDGIAEVWWDDVDTMRRIASTPESKATNEDGDNFMDMRRSRFLLTEELVMKEGPSDPSMVKMVGFATRKPGMDVEAFQAYWKGTHGPVAAKIPVLRRYVQSHVRLSGYRAGLKPIYDGIAETWFDNTDAMRVSKTTAEYQAVRADEPNFIDASKFDFIITKEHAII